MKLPEDVFILFSFLNTQLRDSGLSLRDFCEEHTLDMQAITEKLAAAGFRYDETQRRFR